MKNIQNYCRTNSLPSDYSNEGYSFNKKELYTIGHAKQGAQLNVDTFNFRVAYSVETTLAPTTESVQDLLKAWPVSKKFYRLINRYTMIHDDYPVKIDLSIVRESLNEEQTFKDANILNLNGKYEIEIEVLNDKIDLIK